MVDTKVLHVRDVPMEVHTVLAARAAQRGTSLRQYVVEVLTEHTHRPTMDDWLDGLRELPAHSGIDTVAAIEEARRDDDTG